MKWFRRKKEPKPEPLQAQEVIPRHIVPAAIMDEIRSLPKKDQYRTKDILGEYLKTLNRPELMAYEDADQFTALGDNISEWAWEAYYEEEHIRNWPLGKFAYENTIPDIIRSTISDYDDLKKKVEGMQKKLDRLASLMENTEITMSGKTALKL